MFKVNNKDESQKTIKMTSCSVSIANFEHAIAGWVAPFFIDNVGNRKKTLRAILIFPLC